MLYDNVACELVTATGRSRVTMLGVCWHDSYWCTMLNDNDRQLLVTSLPLFYQWLAGNKNPDHK